jgi:hypothetical protein
MYFYWPDKCFSMTDMSFVLTNMSCLLTAMFFYWPSFLFIWTHTDTFYLWEFCTVESPKCLLWKYENGLRNLSLVVSLQYDRFTRAYNQGFQCPIQNSVGGRKVWQWGEELKSQYLPETRETEYSCQHLLVIKEDIYYVLSFYCIYVHICYCLFPQFLIINHMMKLQRLHFSFELGVAINSHNVHFSLMYSQPSVQAPFVPPLYIPA